jgi:hypothetical protein
MRIGVAKESTETTASAESGIGAKDYAKRSLLTSHKRGYAGRKLGEAKFVFCVTLRIIWHNFLRDIWHNDDI